MLFSRPLVFYTILLVISSYTDFIDAGCTKCRHSSTSSLNRPKRKANEDNSSTESFSSDADSDEFSTAELEDVRLEYIKQQILQRLGMSKAPKVERRQVDVSAILNMFEQKEHQDETATQPPMSDQAQESTETDKVFVLPVISTKTSTTFNLTLNPASNHAVHKISLYLKQKIKPVEMDSLPEKEITLFASAWKNRTSKNNTPFMTIGSVRPSTLSVLLDHDNIMPPDQPQSRWLEYDLTNLLSKHLADKSGGNFITINTKNFKIYDSFINMEFDERQVARKKRSIDCEAGAKDPICCREHFYVNFTHIGWDNWILQPTGYSANYCKGQCDLSNARYHHTTVVQKYPAQISLCCSPREMSHISFIYVDHDGFVYSRILHNMTVESCDCA